MKELKSKQAQVTEITFSKLKFPSKENIIFKLYKIQEQNMENILNIITLRHNVLYLIIKDSWFHLALENKNHYVLT